MVAGNGDPRGWGGRWPPSRPGRRFREAGGARRHRWWIRSFSRPCSRFSDRGSVTLLRGFCSRWGVAGNADEGSAPLIGINLGYQHRRALLSEQKLGCHWKSIRKI